MSVELEYLSFVICAFLLITASVLLIVLSRKFRELKRRDLRFQKDRKAMTNFLNRFAYSVSSGNNFDNTIISVAKYISDSCNAESLAIFFLDPDDEKNMSASAILGKFPQISQLEKHDSPKDKHITLGKGFIGKIAKNKQALIINKPQEDVQLSQIPIVDELHSALISPIVLFNDIKGVICAFNSKSADKQFSDDDLQLLLSMSNNITIAKAMIDNFTTIAEQERLTQELEFARRIQETLVPEELPQFKNIDFHAYNRAAKEVSGDFYDYIRIDETRHLLVVADASGKGVPACLIMTMTRSVLRSACANFHSLEEMILELNDYLVKDTELDRFVTMAFCLIDETSNTFELARAGHTEILLRNQENEVFKIVPNGPAIGLIPNEMNIVFETFSISIAEGYSILFFSDGLTEAEDPYEEQYGLERLINSWTAQNGDAEESIKNILLDVEGFANKDLPQQDDQTILVIKVNKEEEKK